MNPSPNPDPRELPQLHPLTRRRMLVAGLGAVGGGLLAAAGCRSVASPSPVPASEAKRSPFFINLADYAKGDGSDETAAIQRAINDIPPGDWKEDVTTSHPGGVLFIPRPPVCYAISDTLRFIERWNTQIVCESPVWGTRGMPVASYFRWIGRDNGTMFEFRSCKGMVVQNLSMTGLDEACMPDWWLKKWNLKEIGRRSRGVTGIRLGPETQVGFQTSMIFDQLRIADVDVAVRLGVNANNGPDIREITFRNAVLGPFASVGVIAASGNLANITFETVSTCAASDAKTKAAFRLDGGELLILNWNGSGQGTDPEGAEVLINAGGIQIVKAWSEWAGPFLRTASPAPPEWTDGTSGSVNYPMIIEGVRHYEGSWMHRKVNLKEPNPVPASIHYDRPIPLHLLGCSLWGEVRLGSQSEATILDYGTVFVDKDCRGFTGEGVERFGRVVHVGTRHPRNARILQPYFVDRRHVPGTEAPRTGVWEKGDGIINTNPDPTVPARAWRGWICVEAGEPGKWNPYGAIGA